MVHQRLQNQGLKICLGVHLNASHSHIHHEAKIIPVEDHLRMLCIQFLATALQPSHASFSTVTLPNGPRMATLVRTGKTLSHSFSQDVQHLLTNGRMDPTNLKQALKSIHTAVVQASIDNLGPNIIIDAPPPPIDASESKLHRHHRSTLSQLRSGFCICLKNYLFLL